VSADGRSLLLLIIWPASTHRSNWTTFPTPGWHYAHSENGYNDSKISLEWLTRVFDPQPRETANGKSRVLICDGFSWILDHLTWVAKHWCDNPLIRWCDDTPFGYIDRARNIDRNYHTCSHFRVLSVLGHMKHSKSWSSASRILLSCVVCLHIPLTSFSSVMLVLLLL
jgi:hypothetical protein